MTNIFAAALGFAFGCTAQPSFSEEPAESEHAGAEFLLKVAGALADKDRPVWDQARAEALVEDLKAREEKSDFAWDEIDWETDAEAAAVKAAEDQKPIFVYFYLKGNVGPAAAPC